MAQTTRTEHQDRKDRGRLAAIARRAMLERGLLPDFSDAARAELPGLQRHAGGRDFEEKGADVRDLTHLPWCSIDNDDSRDLDQLTVADVPSSDRVTIRVAVADVDALVKKGSAIDEYARHNTTSVYTAGRMFPMLPEELSTDLTSLNPDTERLAIVVDMVAGPEGSVQTSDLYRARVRNHAKLAYRGVAAWLDGRAEAPKGVAAVAGLAENLRIQDRVAQWLRDLRHGRGALRLETIQARPVFEGDTIRAIEADDTNRAKQLIEDFMIAANGVTARFLSAQGLPSLRRVVRTPKRWDRIVELAKSHGATLPAEADAVALDQFLMTSKAANPVGFPDLSLAVVKLLGAGEYVAERAGDNAPGHFGLAVKDYAHSTAPNRRYADLVTQRQVKAALASEDAAYTYEELIALAKHLTEEEDAANKVERQVGKSAAALLLESRIGESFTAIVTGASAKGTWARLLELPVEGRVVSAFEGVDVGDRIRVQLLAIDVERGFIDFKNVGVARQR